jgi:hypothetical protein
MQSECGEKEESEAFHHGGWVGSNADDAGIMSSETSASG